MKFMTMRACEDARLHIADAGRYAQQHNHYDLGSRYTVHHGARLSEEASFETQYPGNCPGRNSDIHRIIYEELEVHEE